MSPKEIVSLANSELIFTVLFVLGLFAVGGFIYKLFNDQKAENATREEQLINLYQNELNKSAAREERLINHLDKQTQQLAHIAETLKDIRRSFAQLESRVDNNLTAIWQGITNKNQPMRSEVFNEQIDSTR